MSSHSAAFAIICSFTLIGLQPACAVDFLVEHESTDASRDIALQAVALDATTGEGGEDLDGFSPPSFTQQLASYAVRTFQNTPDSDIARHIGVQSSFSAHPA